MSTAYHYEFGPSAPSDEVEATLILAVLAAESLHGEAQVRLDAAHTFDPDRRFCTIDAGTAVGRDLNRLFAGFVAREFGRNGFTVTRGPAARAEPVTA